MIRTIGHEPLRGPLQFARFNALRHEPDFVRRCGREFLPPGFDSGAIGPAIDDKFELAIVFIQQPPDDRRFVAIPFVSFRPGTSANRR